MSTPDKSRSQRRCSGSASFGGRVFHIASDRATYGDFPRPIFGITAGDGLQVVWEEAVGTARTKWLLWTGETIDAATAQQWGVVNACAS